MTDTYNNQRLERRTKRSIEGIVDGVSEGRIGSAPPKRIKNEDQQQSKQISDKDLDAEWTAFQKDIASIDRDTGTVIESAAVLRGGEDGTATDKSTSTGNTHQATGIISRNQDEDDEREDAMESLQDELDEQKILIDRVHKLKERREMLRAKSTKEESTNEKSWTSDVRSSATDHTSETYEEDNDEGDDEDEDEDDLSLWIN
ncbi:hypothetical protein V1511DRAFT_518061 [Dipodascopsis uninucleata]